MSKRETLCDYFDEDVVIRHSKSGRMIFGLVIESSENASDSEDEEESDLSSTHSIHKLKPGFAKIACYPSGNTIVLKESKVKLYDRSLLSGDVVQRIDRTNNKLAQNCEHGFCKVTKILATIKILGTDRVIENIDCSQVEMLSNITVDTVCLLDSWVGFVKEVNHSITLKCSDGSILIVNDVDLDDFLDLLTQRENNDSEFSRDDYYIGQQLYGPKRDLKNAKWIVQTKRMKSLMNLNSVRNSKINVVVEDVKIDSVSVNWLYCLANESQNSDPINGNNIKSSKKNMSIKSRDSSMNAMSHPNDLVTGEAIKRITCLNYYGKCSLQIGHQCYYTIKSTDNVIKYSDWEKAESQRLSIDLELDSSRRESTPESDSSDIRIENTFSVNTDSFGTKNRSISDSFSSLSSFGSISSRNKKRRKKAKTRFSLPLKQIKKKKLQASHRMTPYFLPINTSVGSRLPVEIMATNTRVDVVWQNGTVEQDIPSIFLYPVHHIDDHDFYPSDFVVQNKDNLEIFNYGVVQKCDFLSRIATVKWFTVPLNSESAQFLAQEDVSVYDIKDHPDFNYRSGCCVVRISKDESDSYDVTSRAGQVLHITLDGMLRCVWANGQTSLVYPQELFVIGDYDSDDLWEDSDSEYEDYSDLSYSDVNNESWETDSEQTDADKTTAIKSPKKSSKSKSKGKHPNTQVLIDFVHNGATQLEEWLRNGTGNYMNSLQNVVKVFRHAESTLNKVNDSNDLARNQRILNSTSKIHQLSKRLLQLLPFSQHFRRLLSDSKSVETNQSNESETSDLENSPKELQINKESASVDCPSTSETNVTEFLHLIDNLKSEILKNANLPTNGETSDEFADNVDPTLSDSFENVVKEELSSTEISRNEVTEELKMNGTLTESKGNVIFLDTVPDCHKYSATINEPKNAKEFMKRVKQEISLLQTALPDGIDVTLFHDRIDLLSVMVFGPKGTPYEDGLFLFDIQLPANYPNVPPLVHYISYCSDRLNPNLYESGKVCISLLGTWSGRDCEVWSASSSNLLQLIISIQGLILVAEPYYNEAGYTKQRGTTIANENSRLYNEMVVIKLIQSMTKLLLTPPKSFETSIREHIIRIGEQFIKRHQHWASISEECISKSITTIEDLNKYKELRNDAFWPQFPLLPASYGFCLSLNKAIALFKETLLSIN